MPRSIQEVDSLLKDVGRKQTELAELTLITEAGQESRRMALTSLLDETLKLRKESYEAWAVKEVAQVNDILLSNPQQ